MPQNCTFCKCNYFAHRCNNFNVARNAVMKEVDNEKHNQPWPSPSKQLKARANSPLCFQDLLTGGDSHNPKDALDERQGDSFRR